MRIYSWWTRSAEWSVLDYAWSRTVGRYPGLFLERVGFRVNRPEFGNLRWSNRARISGDMPPMPNFEREQLTEIRKLAQEGRGTLVTFDGEKFVDNLGAIVTEAKSVLLGSTEDGSPLVLVPNFRIT